MLYLLLGLFLGIALNFLPILEPARAIEIYPDWHGDIDLIEDIERSENPVTSKFILNPVKIPGGAFILSGNGVLLKRIIAGDHLISLSGSGEYIGKYEKTGTEVEFLNIRGERFWKVKSKEYPYLSFNGKILLLLNGDQSKVRILDNNGNAIGAREIIGRLCTIISFSRNSDFAGIGFLDGSYYILNESGEIITKDSVPANSLVKGISIHSTGNYIAVHYGNNSEDRVRLIDIKGEMLYSIPLKNVHHTKTAMNVSGNGNFSIIDYDRIVITGEEGMIEKIVGIPPARPGLSAIDYVDGLYAASYTKDSGTTQFLFFRDDGTLLLAKEFPGESFIESYIRDSVILLRGSQNLYCYNYVHPGKE